MEAENKGDVLVIAWTTYYINVYQNLMMDRLTEFGFTVPKSSIQYKVDLQIYWVHSVRAIFEKSSKMAQNFGMKMKWKT